MNSNVRQKHETQQEFRARRYAEKLHEKERAKGRLLWNSQTCGTYKRKEHGELLT